MSPADYQRLIDRGWRRSGSYLYKPDLATSCCSCYTIRLDSGLYKLSKGQKKVLKKMSKYLKEDKGQVILQESIGDTIQEPQAPQFAAQPVSTTEMALDTTSYFSVKSTPLLKATHIAQTIQDIEAIADKHQIKVELELAAFHKDTFDLYCKYQRLVHHDEEDHLTEKGFNRFLVETPLRYIEANLVFAPGYGTFHQKYYLDNKLVAVAVIDILPNCVSSVYFFYDPDYSFLSLGNYSALREIALTSQLNSVNAQLKYYYMGYYIHSCVKMRYKGQYKPSELLCPVKLIHVVAVQMGPA